MSDDKFLACLLSENDYSQNGRIQDSTETNSCDKNRSFDESNKEYKVDTSTRRLSASSVESSTENHIDEACKNQTEAEVNRTKKTMINNEVDNMCNSTGAESNLDLEGSKDTLYAKETSHVETSTVVHNIPKQQHNIEIEATDNLLPQQSQGVLDSLQVQQLLDSVLYTIETPPVETTTVVPKHQEIEMKPIDSISSQQSPDILDNLQVQQLQDTLMYAMDTSHVETTTVVHNVPEQQQSIEIEARDTSLPQQSQGVLDSLQVQQLLDSVLYNIETPPVETTTVVPKQQQEEIKLIDSISSQQSEDILNNRQVQQLQMNSDEKCLKYREDVDSSDDDTSSTFSLSSSSDCSDSFLEKMHHSCSPGTKIPIIKTKGELDLDELPPIEDLTINITEREMQKVGTIYAVVDKLVIVRALKDLQPLDLDSVLFLSCKKTLGRIFDVFGPVVEPFYSVRFNSLEHIAEKTIVIDADVFFAPEKTDITSYVFVDQLRKQKGSDASWQNNNEPPEEYLDYSDDDQERAAKRKREAKNRNRHQDSDDVQVIPTKVSRDTTPKNPEEINPWVDIQKYQLSLNNSTQQARSNSSTKNPFRQPYLEGYTSTTFARPVASSERYANHGQERYGTMASQGGTNASIPFSPQQNVPAPRQHQYRPQQPALQRGPVVVSPTYFSPQFAIQPRPSSLHPQPSMTMGPSLQRPLNFMHQPQRSPHPGMVPNQIFGQAPYFSNSLPSPMGIPPPPVASPAAFAYRPDARNFMNQPANFPNQASHFLNRAMNQPANFVNQPSTSLHQNPLLAQPGRLQWQNGPPSPYGMTPLSISIPNAPPSNAIYTPVPSPYNMWGSKSLNFPQSYFGNNL